MHSIKSVYWGKKKQKTKIKLSKNNDNNIMENYIRCSKCCGNGVVEVKCPFSIKDKHIEEGVSNKDLVLLYDCESNVDTWSVLIPHGKQSGSFTLPTGLPALTNLCLKENEPHYYQLQTQMMVCESTFSRL